MYRCLHWTAPLYLSDVCTLISTKPTRSQLRSASSGDLIVPRTRTVTYGPHSFSFSGPTIWNALPTHIPDPLLTLKQFSTKLKPLMFTRAYYARPWRIRDDLCVIRTARYKCTYIYTYIHLKLAALTMTHYYTSSSYYDSFLHWQLLLWLILTLAALTMTHSYTSSSYYDSFLHWKLLLWLILTLAALTLTHSYTTSSYYDSFLH